jgi:hypothetical protein
MTTSTQSPGVLFTEDGAVVTRGNGRVVSYNRINGIYYRTDTPAPVVAILEQSRSCRERLRLHLGNTQTGRDWLEEWDVEGHIGNSIGPLKVPLLIYNRRSSGGPAILDQCIVKIRRTGSNGAVIYQHPTYHAGTFTIREIGLDESCGDVNLREKGYSHAVDVNGENHANFRSLPAAERFVKKMTG